MAVAFVKLVGQTANAGSSATVAVTVAAGGVPAGNTVIITLNANGDGTVNSVADTRGNTWRIDRQSTSTTGGQLVSSLITTALQAGDTITVTGSASVAGRIAIAAEFSGIGGVQVNGSTTGTGTTATGTTTDPAGADGVAVAMFGEASVAADFQNLDANYTEIARQAGSSTRSQLMAYRVSNPSGVNTATVDFPASSTWRAGVAVYMPTAYPVPANAPGWTWRRRFRNRQLLPSALAAPAPPVTTQDLPPQVPARDRVSWLARAKARKAEPPLPPAVVVTVQALPPQTPTRDRVFWLARAKARRAEPPPVPVVTVTTQGLPPQPPTRRRTLPWRRRARYTTVVTVAPTLPPQPGRDRPVPLSRRRARTAAPPPAPVVTVTTQALPPQPATRDRVFWLPRAKARQAQPVPAQVVVVTAQALPPQPGRRRWGFLPRVRARQAQPVPAQVVVQTVQALPPQPARRRFGFLPRAKGRTAQPVLPPVVVVTAQALPPQPGRRRFAFRPKATARTAQPVRPQVIVVTTQALPAQPGRRRLRFLPRPRRGLATQLFRVYVINPNDGVPVDNPGLTLTSPVAGLPLSSPIAGMLLTSPIAGMGLTSPVARLELVMATFYTGDTSPDLTGTCTSNGVAANITGATLALHLRKPDGTIVTKTGTIVSGPAGTWSYSWIAGDLNLSGPWSVEVQVTYSGGKIQTFGPSAFAVVEQFA